MKQALLAIAAASAMLATTSAPAQDRAPSVPVDTPAQPASQGGTADPASDRTFRLEEIDAAIREQERHGKAGTDRIFLGSTMIGFGVLISAIMTAGEKREAEEEADENGQSEYTYEVDASAAVVAAAIGIPLIVTGIVQKVRANRRAHELMSDRTSLTMSTGPDGAPMVSLRWAF